MSKYVPQESRHVNALLISDLTLIHLCDSGQLAPENSFAKTIDSSAGDWASIGGNLAAGDALQRVWS